jgi:hypothetical protein
VIGPDPSPDAPRAAVRGVVPTREAVAADVRRIIGGCRARGDFERLDTPALDRLLALQGRDHEQGPDLVAEAIAAVDRDRYRRFLEILLPLPFDEGERWPSLGRSRRGPGRGDLAAAVFDLDTWDGCTRATQSLDGRSRRDWAELHLATALIEQAAGPPMGSAERPASPDDDAAAGTRRHPRAAVIVAAVVAVLVLAGAAILLATSTSTSRHGAGSGAGGRAAVAGTSPTHASGVLAATCVPVGEPGPALASEWGSRVLLDTLRDVYARAGGSARLGCGLGPARRWEDLVVQEIDSGEEHLPAAIVVSGPHHGMVLNGAQWGSYRRVGAADGHLAQTVGGVPEQAVTRPDGSVELDLSQGTVMVAEAADEPYFWLPAAYVAWWRDHPELGRPTGNPLPTFAQDFEHGIAAVAALGAPDPHILPIADPGAGLPPAASRRGHILRQLDGTAWWVDRSDRRHWIPSAEVWDCLGGEEVVLPHDVPGFAVASLPRGSHARCPKHH